MRILGIDPGTGICGFGVIEVGGDQKNDLSHQNTPARKNTSAHQNASAHKTDQKATHAKAIASPKVIDNGVITTPAHTPLPDRLEDIYNSLHEIIELNQPDVVSIEKLFFTKNITTGISVAEARGICLLVAKQHKIPIFEYTPNEIKKTMTGYGNADKKQMQEMVKIRLNLSQIPKPDDAADALAAALTHLYASKTLSKIINV